MAITLSPRRILLLWLLAIPLLLCLPVTCAKFLAGQEVGRVYADDIEEASGLAASWRNEGLLWTHNDVDGTAIIFAVSVNGDYLGGYELEGATRRDMEDIAVGPGPDPGESYIYLGDIGNNNEKVDSREYIQIYRVREPPPPNGGIQSLGSVDTIELFYPEYDPDEYIDSEALLVDPILGEIYVLEKRGLRTTVYATPPSTAFAPGSFSQTLEERGKIEDITRITGGDISRSGKEILLKKIENVYYFRREGDGPISQSLINLEGFQQLDYVQENQGEGITFATDLAGYYTLSETAKAHSVPLLYYPRIGTAEDLPDLPPRTPLPTRRPTPDPTREPTEEPSRTPTPKPTIFPITRRPTETPTTAPPTTPFPTAKRYASTSFSIVIPIPPPPPPTLNPSSDPSIHTNSTHFNTSATNGNTIMSDLGSSNNRTNTTNCTGTVTGTATTVNKTEKSLCNP